MAATITIHFRKNHSAVSLTGRLSGALASSPLSRLSGVPDVGDVDVGDVGDASDVRGDDDVWLSDESRGMALMLTYSFWRLAFGFLKITANLKLPIRLPNFDLITLDRMCSHCTTTQLDAHVLGQLPNERSSGFSAKGSP